MYTANGEYIDKNRIIENMNNNTFNADDMNQTAISEIDQTANKINFKVDDLTTQAIIDNEKKTFSIEDNGGTIDITDNMEIHELLPQIPNEVRNKLKITIYFKFYIPNKNNIKFNIYTNRTFNLNGQNNIVKLISKDNYDIKLNDIDKSPKYKYVFNIQKKNNKNNNMIFNIKINPNANNIPYFRITNIKNALSTTPYGNRQGITHIPTLYGNIQGIGQGPTLYGNRQGIGQGITQISTPYGNIQDIAQGPTLYGYR
jgi:hypothetical protein